MYFITTIQDNIYLNWQVELLAYNLRQFNFSLLALVGYVGKPSESALQLSKKCKVEFIEDTRSNKLYAPSIQPHLLKKFNRSLRDVVIIDSDVLLKTTHNFIQPTKNCIYGSDVASYISARYIDGCDPYILQGMCDIVGIDIEFVRNHKHSIGAHYFLPHMFDYEFWDNIENNSNKLYNFISKYKCSIHDIQIWTASMWAILWEMYKREQKDECTVLSDKSFDFCWATDPVSVYDNVDILHMSGVTADMKDNGYFYKGNYTNNTPFTEDLSYVSDTNCSYKYVEYINKYVNSQKA